MKFKIGDFIVDKHDGTLYEIIGFDKKDDNAMILATGGHEMAGFAWNEEDFVKVDTSGWKLIRSVRDTSNIEECPARAEAANILSNTDAFGKVYYDFEDALTECLNGTNKEIVFPSIDKRTKIIENMINWEFTSAIVDSLITIGEVHNASIYEDITEELQSYYDDHNSLPDKIAHNTFCQIISYYRYLDIWNEDTDRVGQEPASYEEFVDNEYQSEEERKIYNSI